MEITIARILIIALVLGIIITLITAANLFPAAAQIKNSGSNTTQIVCFAISLQKGGYPLQWFELISGCESGYNILALPFFLDVVFWFAIVAIAMLLGSRISK